MLGVEGEHFISEIRNHPVLWDNKHPDFNNRHVKLAAWEDVATKVFEDSETWSRYDKFAKVREIQKKWKNMRDNFIRELKYQRKVDKGVAKPKKKKYMYSELLTFLVPRNQEKNKSSADSEESNSDQEDTENDDVGTPAMDFKHPVSVGSSQSVDSNTVHNFDSHREGNSYLEDYLRQQGCYQNIEEQTNLNRIQQFHSDVGNMVNSTSADQMDFDDDKMFLLSMLPYFKKLDDAKKLHTRIQFTKLLYDQVYKNS